MVTHCERYDGEDSVMVTEVILPSFTIPFLDVVGLCVSQWLIRASGFYLVSTGLVKR